MTEQFEMPSPTDEHRLLQKTVGTWKVDCKYFMDPTQPPMQTEATETIEAVGPFWTVSKFETDFMGMPFVGRATLGFDAHAGKWVGTWIDAMSSVLFQYEGKPKAGAKSLEMRGRAFMAQCGGDSDFRMTIDLSHDSQHRFEMFVTPPGGSESKMFSYDYTRA